MHYELKNEIKYIPIISDHVFVFTVCLPSLLNLHLKLIQPSLCCQSIARFLSYALSPSIYHQPIKNDPIILPPSKMATWWCIMTLQGKIPDLTDLNHYKFAIDSSIHQSCLKLLASLSLNLILSRLLHNHLTGCQSKLAAVAPSVRVNVLPLPCLLQQILP